MRRRRHGSARLSAFLIVVCACLAVALYWQLRSWNTVPSDSESVEDQQAMTPDNGSDVPARQEPDLEIPAAGTFAEIYERPLFSQSRRPPPVNAEPAATEEEDVVVEKPEFILRGVIVSKDQRVAILQTQTATRLEHLLEGQELEGWTVETVDPEKIVMRRGPETVEFLLEDTFRKKQQPPPRSSRRTRQRRPPSRSQRQPPPATEQGDPTADENQDDGKND